MPVYNVELYLDKCVESIVNQTYKNLEIILVDDGSPDKCAIICDKWAQKDERIKVIHKKNGGLSDARNIGIELAKGEYIAFVDSDDYLEADMYEKLFSAMIKNDADIAMCNFNCVNHADKEIKNQVLSRNLIIKNECLTRNECFNKILTSFNYVVAWNKLYKRQVFEKIRYPVNKIHEDEFVIHHLFNASKNIVCIEDCLYNYVQVNTSIMGQSYNVKRLDYLNALYDRYLFYESIKLSKLKNNTGYIFFSDLLKAYMYLDINNSLISKDLKRYKRIYNSIYFCSMIGATLKQKILMSVFLINPTFCINIIKFRNVKNDTSRLTYR